MIGCVAYREPYTPYCGLTYNDQNRPVRADSAPHIAISAPTRTGKTRRILARLCPVGRLSRNHRLGGAAGVRFL
jgi:hypothetical protein